MKGEEEQPHAADVSVPAAHDGGKEGGGGGEEEAAEPSAGPPTHLTSAPSASARRKTRSVDDSGKPKDCELEQTSVCSPAVCSPPHWLTPLPLFWLRSLLQRHDRPGPGPTVPDHGEAIWG
jgi:hypothetical protein